MPDGNDGGNGEPQGTSTGAGEEPQGTEHTGGEGEPQGEPGSLEEWKAHTRKHELRAKDSKREADTLRREVEELKSKHATDEEKAIDAARKEGEASALDRANARSVRAAVIVRAAGKLADPTDAAALLELGQFEVDDDGNVDEKAVDDAIAELLKAKPHLSARPTKPQGDVGQGPQGNGESQTPNMDQWLRNAAGRS